jgi:hypothetical protein
MFNSILVHLQFDREHFVEIFLVCFEKVMFVSVVSIPAQNSKTNRKKICLLSRNKPKKNRHRLSFGLFQFEPKKN